jgi:hypothetical protein
MKVKRKLKECTIRKPVIQSVEFPEREERKDQKAYSERIPEIPQI